MSNNLENSKEHASHAYYLQIKNYSLEGKLIEHDFHENNPEY